MREHRIETPDGRVLAAVEGGDPNGAPVIVHHGTPMSRLLYEPHVADAKAHGLRLIGYDRPGYGDSTPQPGRAVADAARDVATIADALGIERFATWGISGGGPYALACAALLPDRVVAAASLAGVAPYDAKDLDWLAGMGESNVEEFSLTLQGRDKLEPAVRDMRDAMIAGGVGGVKEALRTLLSPVDAAAYSGATAEYMFAAFRVGSDERIDGWIDDDLAFAEPWGFSVEQISVPVLLWQGVEDRFVPPAHGEWLARRIPTCEPHLSPADGHITLLERRVSDVHEWLATALRNVVTTR
jgi:pimeloyl-ACP methyl ester carboxylesterase